MRKNNSKKELLFQLHEQFSENQNDIGSRFNTIMIALISLFGFYGFTYSLATGLVSIKDYFISKNVVFLFAIIVEMVLVFLISLLIYMGYQHRRDQALNTKIRKHYVGNDFEHFFSNYTGENKGLLDFIPDFLVIKALFLVSLKVLLLFSLLILPVLGEAQVVSDSSINPYSSATSSAEINFNKTYHITKALSENTRLDSSKGGYIQNIMTVTDLSKNEPITNPISIYKDNTFFLASIFVWGLGLVVLIAILLCYHKKSKKLNTNSFNYTKTIEHNSAGKVTKITINKTT